MVVLLHHLVLFTNARWPITFTYLGLLVLALVFNLRGAFHIAFLMALWRTLHFILPGFLLSASAFYLALLFFISAAVVVCVFPKEKLSWLRKGNVTKRDVTWALIVSVVSAVALILWAFWTNNLGMGARMVRGVSHFPKPLIFLLGVPVFACLNAFSEEIIYRGVLQEATLRVNIKPGIGILLQASAFAALHFLGGFPNGYVGYIMTFVYGTALGILRHKTKGMLIPYVTHVTADLVIMYFLCFRFLT